MCSENRRTLVLNTFGVGAPFNANRGGFHLQSETDKLVVWSPAKVLVLVPWYVLCVRSALRYWVCVCLVQYLYWYHLMHDIVYGLL